MEQNTLNLNQNLGSSTDRPIDVDADDGSQTTVESIGKLQAHIREIAGAEISCEEAERLLKRAAPSVSLHFQSSDIDSAVAAYFDDMCR